MSTKRLTWEGVVKAGVALVAGTSVAGAVVGQWPVELAGHFPGHVAATLLVLAVPLALRKRWRWVAFAAIVAAGQAARMAPAWRPGPATAEAPADGAEGATVRIASLNVYFKSGRYADAAAYLIGTEAQVLVLIEVTPEWLDQLTPLRARWPHVVTEQRDGRDGMAVFSKLPILEHDTVDLTGGGRVTLRVRLQAPGGPMTLIAFHPLTPTLPHLARLRDVEIHELARLVRTLEGPVAVIGDFNCTPWSPIFRRLLSESGLADARRGHGLQATWPAPLMDFGIPIDQCLVSSQLKSLRFEAGPRVGSDHRGIVVDLVDVEAAATDGAAAP